MMMKNWLFVILLIVLHYPTYLPQKKLIEISSLQLRIWKIGYL